MRPWLKRVPRTALLVAGVAALVESRAQWHGGLAWDWSFLMLSLGVLLLWAFDRIER